MKNFVIIAASLLIAGTASANQFNFKYSSADLASPEAVASLHKRISTEARSYCMREYSKTRDLKLKDTCVDNFVKVVSSGIDGGARYAGVATSNQTES
jgi:UrcA family protein